VTIATSPAFARGESRGLTCHGVSLAEIAARAGTPTYVYAAPAIREAWRRLDAAFDGVPHALHYALKANSTLALLRLLRELGSGADANSGGEIEVALRAGFTPGDIVFTGVGKTPEELARAVALGVKAINAESPGELERIAAFAVARNTRARVAIRLNPDIDARSHPHISTGRRSNKFGVPIELAPQLYRDIARTPGLEPVGVHVHVGSQITVLDPLRRAAEAAVALAVALRSEGIPIDHVDLGGGLGIPYDGSPVPGIEEYAAALLPVVRGRGLSLLLEPGRVVVGASGVLLARVVDVKSFPGGRPFAVLDAGMTELLRPALYGAYHRIEPVAPRAGERVRYDVVGPLCESSDTVGKDRDLPPLEVNDLVAVFDAGAYGSAMSFTYNRRPLPCEVLVDDDGWRVIRRRQTIDDLLALEIESAGK
jgi:diaminopimelate decarboxylase